MANEWHMIITISWQGNVRQALTTHLHREAAIFAMEDMLIHDRDAERGHVLLSKIEPNGVRRWQPVMTMRRRRCGGATDLVEEPCA